MAPTLRLLQTAFDSWDRGHDFPDVVAGRLFGNSLIFLRVENRGSAPLDNVQLHVEGSKHLAPSAGRISRLQPGQRSSVYAPLVQLVGSTVDHRDCPLRVQLRIEADGGVAISTRKQLLCRKMDDRISFVYLDADGSPQMAAAKFPADTPAANRSECASDGCAVLLSTHGMDVTAQRQADCYARKANAWVLAPHGRGTHGFNWQGPGHWSALYALEALAQLAEHWSSTTEEQGGLGVQV